MFFVVVLLNFMRFAFGPQHPASQGEEGMKGEHIGYLHSGGE
jgi:NADH:ubiquinone oxidoreductase subunit D